MMRVVLLAHVFPRAVDDPLGAFLLHLIQAEQARAEMHVIAPHAPGLAERETLAGVPVTRFRYAPDEQETLAYTGIMHEQVARSIGGKTLFGRFLTAYFRAALAAVRQHRAEVIHAHWWLPGGFVGALVSRLTNTPLVVTTHGTDVEQLRRAPNTSALARFTFGRARMITCGANYQRAQLAELRVAEPARIRVIPMPVNPLFLNTELLGRVKNSNQKFQILTVSRLTRQKSVDTLLDALALVRARGIDAHLRIIGDGDQRAALESKTRADGLESFVEFLGMRPQSELTSYYADCNAFVLTSLREGLGLVLAEALLSGAPVIATNSGGVPDIICDGETGLLFPERDATALANALERYARDPAYAARLAEQGRARVIERFSPDSVAAQFLDTYAAPPPAPNSNASVTSASVESVPSLSRDPSSSDRVIALLLALLLFAIYLGVFNGRITSSDGLSMFAVTESLVKRADVTTDQMWTFFGTKSEPAPDGEAYSKYGYGTSLFAVPLYTLSYWLPFSGLMQVTLLSSAVATALTAAVIFLSARALNFSAIVSVLVALLFGLATPAFVYAKEFWSEPFATFTLIAGFYFSLRYRRSAALRDALLAGVFVGLALAVRTTNLILVPLYLWYTFLPREQFRARPLVAFLAPVALFGVCILLYNYVRFQNPFTTGYRADEDFSNNIVLGAYGLLFSPGKGLLVYAPFLAALPFGVWQFYHHHRRELGFILLLATCYLILFSAWYYWWGGTNWAARFLVPTLPFLAILCAPLVQLLLEPPPEASRAALLALRSTFLVLVGISLINELAGVSVNSLTYRLRTLPLSSNPDWDAIFLPALSPLIGHWQTLKPTNLDMAWLRATPDTIQVDWLVVLLSVAFILFCGWLLIRALRGHALPRLLVIGTLLAAVILTILTLARYADDPRLGDNPGYAALLQTLAEQSNPGDVAILNDDAHARFFLNANRSPLKWYGLSRDPARWDTPTQTLVKRVLQQSPRVWFAYDDTVDAPNPMRDWFAANLTETQRYAFPNDTYLVLYNPP